MTAAIFLRYIDDVMDRSEILAALAERSRMPWGILSACLEEQNRTQTIFLSLLTRIGDGPRLSEREEAALYYGIHLLGALKTHEALGPLMILLANHREETDRILGDPALGETLPRILMALSQSDADLLWQAATGGPADWLIRDAYLKAWAYEVLCGQVERAKARHLLREFPNIVSLQAADPLWVSWLNTASDVGFAALFQTVPGLVSSGRIAGGSLGLSDRDLSALANAAASNTPQKRKTANWRLTHGYIPFGASPYTKYDFYSAARLAPGTTEDERRAIVSQAAEEKVAGPVFPDHAENENTPPRSGSK
ncbi:MAG: hypothetical protein JJ902_00925 [Roseibium sp.]|nr:hypothetical protein [Roseibium sp.]